MGEETVLAHIFIHVVGLFLHFSDMFLKSISLISLERFKIMLIKASTEAKQFWSCIQNQHHFVTYYNVMFYRGSSISKSIPSPH